MSIFEVGSIVKLKSGGPIMTVQEISPQYDNGVKLSENNALCRWFNSNDEIKECWFDEKALSEETEIQL